MLEEIEAPVEMPPVEPAPPRAIDLLESTRTARLRSTVMENFAERFMRQIAFALFQRIRHSVQLQSCTSSVLSHKAAISGLPRVMLAGIATLSPLRGRMLVAIDGELIGAVVDAMCGAAEVQSFPRQELSTLETRIGKQIIDLACATMAETLSGLMPLGITIAGYENAAGLLAIADGQDWMVAVSGMFETDVGAGSISVITPYAALEPLEVKLGAQSGLLGHGVRDEGWIAALASLTDEMPLELRFHLARAVMPVGAFAAMAPGDVLPFSLWPEAVAVAEGTDLFLADYGQSGGQVCCRARLEMPAEGMADQPREATSMTGKTAPPVRNETPRGEGARVALESLQSAPGGGPVLAGKPLIDRVQVMLTVELGRARMTVKELRQLRQGQVIGLEQAVGEPLSLYANGQMIAYGEVVAVPNDRYGVRITALADETIAPFEPAA